MNQKLKIVAVGYHNEKLNMAKVWLHAGEYSIPHQEAVMDISLDQVLLEQDLGIRCYLKNLTEQQAENWKKADVPVLVTRHQAKEDLQQQAEDDGRKLESGARMVENIYEFDDFIFTQNEPRMLDRNKW